MVAQVLKETISVERKRENTQLLHLRNTEYES
uniref:Transposase n=1 Tax=Heterorhabditis bacteriophora TaxID=37862 RepID=A0A1I7XCC5_HETBA